jgi:hypothetical protein
MAGVDAFAIVINFNRSLIHQFHYFISLRMALLAVIIPAAMLLLYNKYAYPLGCVYLGTDGVDTYAHAAFARDNIRERM